jgi:phytanoyl-CoA hydroxylase
MERAPAVTTVEDGWTLRLDDGDLERFRADGFIVVDRIIDPATIPDLLASYDALFDGSFETGLRPDEWNWKAGRDAPDLTRQICNGWKSDRAIAATVLGADIGRACAFLGEWPGTRLSQDNVLWKPPGGRALGFHQDSSYEQWADPPDWVSCWIALDDTTAAGGTVEYVRGSHRWGASGMIDEFHGPDDPDRELRDAARQAGVSAERVPVEVAAGGGAFHAGWTWHGSAVNRTDVPRRALVAHCMSSETRFHPTVTGSVYSRYKRFGDLAMGETDFPVLWRRDGYRSPFIDPYVTRQIGWGGTPRPTPE